VQTIAINLNSLFTRLSLILIALGSVHVFRNVSEFYILFYGAVAILVLLQFVVNKASRLSVISLFIIIAWLFACLNTFATYTFSSITLESPLLGIQRLMFTLPILLWITSSLDYASRINVFRVCLFFGVVAALSLPYQIIFGAITWLADTGERSGLVRYTTTLGSLTIFGNLAGAYLLMSLYLVRSSIFSVSLALLIVVAGVLSLQKAALGSLLIGVFFAFKLGLMSSRRLCAFVIISIIAGCFSIFFVNQDLFAGLKLFILNFMGIGDEAQFSDRTVIESFIDRFTKLPAEVFKYWGYPHVLIGVGAYGAAGSLGYPEIPHPHNLAVELLALFGVLAIPMLAFFLKYFLLSIKYIIWPGGECLFVRFSMAVFVVTLVPSVLSGGLLYHPISGVIFANSLALIFFAIKKNTNSLGLIKQPESVKKHSKTLFHY